MKQSKSRRKGTIPSLAGSASIITALDPQKKRVADILRDNNPMPHSNLRKPFRIRIHSRNISYYKLLLFWPAYFLSFFLLERFSHGVVYHPVHCALDDLIPFCEWFLFPYLAWHVLIAFMVLYTLQYEVYAFRKFMWYFIATYCVTLLVYILYPTCQELRPEVFPRDNLLTAAVRFIYWFDTSTNVCPSMHITGAVGLWLTARECRAFSSSVWKIGWGFIVLAICVSTLFMKQHSVIDVLAALPVSAFGYAVCICMRGKPS